MGKQLTFKDRHSESVQVESSRLDGAETEEARDEKYICDAGWSGQKIVSEEPRDLGGWQ